MIGQGHSAWFRCLKPDPAARIRLICFCHSGGAPSAYRTWPAALQGVAEVHAVNLPGHGTRMAEPACVSMGALLEALPEAVAPLLDRPVAFWGHSLGSLVSFELARAMRARRWPAPARLVVGGLNAPDVPNTKPLMHTLPDAEFVARLPLYGGTPGELLQNRELLELVLPPLRADFTICETYRYEPQPPLPCPITVVGGTEDPVTDPEGLRAWRRHTTAACDIRMVSGDHFFPKASESVVLDLLRDLLAPLSGRNSA